MIAQFNSVVTGMGKVYTWKVYTSYNTVELEWEKYILGKYILLSYCVSNLNVTVHCKLVFL